MREGNNFTLHADLCSVTDGRTKFDADFFFFLIPIWKAAFGATRATLAIHERPPCSLLVQHVTSDSREKSYRSQCTSEALIYDSSIILRSVTAKAAASRAQTEVRGCDGGQPRWWTRGNCWISHVFTPTAHPGYGIMQPDLFIAQTSGFLLFTPSSDLSPQQLGEDPRAADRARRAAAQRPPNSSARKGKPGQQLIPAGTFVIGEVKKRWNCARPSIIKSSGQIVSLFMWCTTPCVIPPSSPQDLWITLL